MSTRYGGSSGAGIGHRQLPPIEDDYEENQSTDYGDDEEGGGGGGGRRLRLEEVLEHHIGGGDDSILDIDCKAPRNHPTRLALRQRNGVDTANAMKSKNRFIIVGLRCRSRREEFPSEE